MTGSRLPVAATTGLQPACLHGDLWRENILADAEGEPSLIDPAVSYTWPEMDLSTFMSAVSGVTPKSGSHVDSAGAMIDTWVAKRVA